MAGRIGDMSYILVAEDETEIREVYEIVLKRSFPLDVVMVDSANKAIRIIRERGVPVLIISDSKMPDGDGLLLYQANIENGWNVPFILASNEIAQYKVKFPNALGFVEKPDVVKPLIELVKKVISVPREMPLFVPVGISFLLRKGTSHYDLYMKLSEHKFVKVFNAGEAFIPSDAERFKTKGLEHLYITASDAENFLTLFEQNIKMILASSHNTKEVLPLLSLESLESVERIAKGLGWTPAVLESAKHAVDLAIKAVTLEPDLYRLFKQKMSNPSSEFSHHTSQLALLTCGFCYQLGWQSESTQMKLGLASLMHDIAVDEAAYQDIQLWNQAATDQHDKTPAIIKYRNHPIEAASMLLKMKSLPADVDQIILQHHEAKDGLGFPRGLTASRISPMATIFIITEDLITFMEKSHNIEEKVELFLKYRESKYNSGNFKKVFEAFKESVEKSRHLK